MTEVKFTKLQGNGNDFILVDEYDRVVVPEDKKAAFARKYCHRRFGVGADGVLFLSRLGRAPLRMRIFNEDGSEAEMCGNGVRCFAMYALNAGYVNEGKTAVDTLAGVLEIETKKEDGKVLVKVSMGKVIFDRKKIPATGMGNFMNIPLHGYEVSAVNTGVPHAVVFVENLDDPELMVMAPQIRYDKIFPKGANVNFATREMGGLRIRTYERGVEGETYSCGTGSVASAAVARHMGMVRDTVKVKTKGGELTISFMNDYAFMEGGAEKTYEGKLDVDFTSL